MTVAVSLMVCLDARPLSSAEPEANPPARAARQSELDAVTRDIALTEERQAELRKEIDALDKDRATLNQVLIETSQKVQTLEGEIAKTEERMQGLAGNEAELHASLLARRDVLAEVLAALQRMGHRPPPAILVRPEDALASVRSAILLGAVVPDLRSAADKVAADLRELVSLKEEIARERHRMMSDATSLAEERTRVRLLLAEKRNQQVASERALAEEQGRAAALAEQATTLKELIARMESETRC